MSRTALGFVFALLFVALESGQFVYFGGLFQHLNSFLFGFLVFGLTVIIFVGHTSMFRRQQIHNALAMPRCLLAINLGAICTFTAYLLSVQLIEPAVTYTISSGAMPISAFLLYLLGMRGTGGFRSSMEAIGVSAIFLSLCYLIFITLTGQSGFVRGDTPVALLGIALAILDGFFFTLILVHSQRLDRGGVGPAAILGLRLPLYVLVTGFIALEVTHGSQFPPMKQLTLYVLIGFLLTIPPLYFLQKAVSYISTLSISAITALGPLVIFGLQLVESRVAYSTATIIGLLLYLAGALVTAFGSFQSEPERAVVNEMKG